MVIVVSVHPKIIYTTSLTGSKSKNSVYIAKSSDSH